MKIAIRGTIACLAFLCSMLLIAGCGGGGGSKGTPPLGTIIAPSMDPLGATEAIATGRVIDATTGERIDDAVISVGGKTLSDNGLFSYEPSFSSAETKAQVLFEARAAGYIPSTALVSLEKGSNATVILTLIEEKLDGDGKITTMPAGSVGRVEILGATGGSMPEHAGISTPTEGNIASFKVTPLPDTYLYGADNKLITGDVKKRVLSFDPNAVDTDGSNSPLQYFPGGFAVSVGKDSSGGMNSGTIAAAWFGAIDFIEQSTGREVKSFGSSGGGLKIDLTLPTGAVNPSSGDLLKQGDSLALWSYDDSTGEWQYEGDASVQGTGPYQVSFELDHLSYWALGHFYDQTSVNDAEILIVGGDERQLSITAQLENRVGYHYSGLHRPTDGLFRIVNAICNESIDVTARLGDKVVGSKAFGNLCGSGPFDLPVPDLPAAPAGGLKVTVVEACENGSHERPLPNSPVFWESGKVAGNAVTNDKGILEVSGLTPGPYPITVINRRDGSKEYDAVLVASKIEAAKIVFTMQCTGITGATGATGGSGI